MDEWTNQAEHELPPSFFEGLPEPLFWRVLVLPRSAKQKSAGGIIITPAAQEAESHLCYVGQVLALGPQAFKEARLGDSKVEVGEWIVYGRYAGQRLQYKGIKILIVNDDEILGKVCDPDSLRVHI